MNPLFKPTSYKKGAALAVSATLVWKFISFANALLLAAYFGATSKTDVYFYVIMLMGLGVGFLQRLNQTVLIPQAMFLHEKSNHTAQQFLTMWLYIYVGLGLLAAITGTLWTQEVWQVVSRFRAPLLAQDQHLLVCGVWLFALQLLTYYLTAVAEMYRFFKTAWLGVLNALCPLVCLIIGANTWGIVSMVYGFLVANVVQLAVLLTLLRTQLQWDFTPCFVPLHTQTRQNMLTGQTLAVWDIVNSLLPLYLMSAMGAGLISALNYCKQFTDSTTEILTARVANVAKIEMTAHAAQQNPQAFHAVFVQLNHLLLVILGPLVVFSCYFAPQIVDLFLGRGQFGPQAAHNTVTFLRPMLVTVLLLVPAYLQSSTLAAWRKINTNFPYSAGSSLVYTLALLVLLPRWGAFSYPYIYAGALGVGWGVSFMFFRRHFPQVPFLQTVWDFLRLLGLNGCALIPAVGMYHALPATSSWMCLLVCGSVFMAGYILLLTLSKDGVQFIREIKTQQPA